ncbi:hypothetical protein I8751_03230 [Nostocaceae cyanobacterium CENA357]|uniref:Uncharacterized protein n=1 Tax=Atlanticothrix silvestris CENA357 TaxID=1725252 RepID=A0A8J7L3W9_9CYAN|nr:hypothetical protein [Atlanticothrix silvestris]MBH8551407.1 hypothetical protein [Atlanticothrix silvestris CENA357]
MAIQELEQQLLQLSPNDKLYIIQLLAQSLTTHNNNTHPELSRGWALLKTLIESSLQPETQTETPEYPQTQFYGCIQDETFFRHPQEQQQEREPIL